jgi:hypothetical protein
MSNRWGISKEVELQVINRDVNCIYCGISFQNESIAIKNRPSWEHIINDIRLNGADNIARCCRACNASKGSKLLVDWLKSKYCIQKGINENTLARVAKNYVSKIETKSNR